MLSHITATTTSSAILRARAAGRCGVVRPERNPRMIGIAIITNAVGNSHNTPNSTALSDAREFGVLFRSSRNSNGATRIAPITAALGPTRTDLLLSMSGPYQHDGAALGGGASVALLEQSSAAGEACEPRLVDHRE